MQPNSDQQPNLAQPNTYGASNSATKKSAVPLQMPATSPKAPKRPKRLFRRIFFSLVAVLLGVVIATLIDYRAIYDWLLGFSYQPSSTMSQTISNIDLTDRGLRIVKASFAEFQDSDSFNKNCPTATAETSVLGCYYDWHIYVYDVDNAELDGIKEAVLAHELLHADWQRERQWIKDELEPILRQTYEDNKDELSEHMKTYSEENFVDELHSVIGTQLDTSKLPQRLQDHYRSLFKNHDKIVGYFNQYNDKFLRLRQEMEDLAAKIEKMKAEIEEKTEVYRKKSQSLSKDIDLFNRRATSNYYTDELSFNRDRAALVARQEALNKDYKELSELVDEANKYVEQYNQNVARSSELYRSIDSNFKTIEEPTK